jgi:hypothetical protein
MHPFIFLERWCWTKNKRRPLTSRKDKSLMVSKDRAYVGLSSNISSRLRDNHHIIGGFDDGDIDLWIGLISSQSVAGRKPNNSYLTHSEALHLAEHMTAYFLQLTENDRKRRNQPMRSVVVFNRWFKAYDPYARRMHRGASFWPDLIEYDANELTARKVWFGGKYERLSAADVDLLKKTS